VDVKSDGPGQGSEFIVRLPRLAGPPAPKPVPATAHAVRKTPGLRILVVDDNVDAAESLAYLLRTDGHDVTTAYEGVSAIELANKLHPDVVLLDIGLPGMSGHEVASRLRHDHPNRNLVLIALTGYGQEEDRRRSEEVGINAHLTKPVDLADLRALLCSPSGKR
jgi:CheY-like chemotaxis protein